MSDQTPAVLIMARAPRAGEVRRALGRVQAFEREPLAPGAHRLHVHPERPERRHCARAGFDHPVRPGPERVALAQGAVDRDTDLATQVLIARARRQPRRRVRGARLTEHTTGDAVEQRQQLLQARIRQLVDHLPSAAPHRDQATFAQPAQVVG